MAVLKCRKNVARLTDAEKAKYRDAVFRLRELGRYDKYVRMHAFVSNLGHSGPAFFPWHRVFVHKFEEELQEIDPDVTVPYWDWTSNNLDSGGNSLIWRDDFLGRNGNVTLTWTGQDGTTKTWTIRRRNFNITSSPGDNGVSNALAQNDYPSFRPALEGTVHGGAHVWLGIPGDQDDFATAVNDPWFFLLHSNVDRLWMEWQQRKKAQWLAANPGMEYPQSQLAVDYFYDKSDPPHTWTTPPNRHNLDDVFWPWDGTQTLTGGPNSAFSPWKDGMPEVYTPRGALNHHNFGYVYDPEPPTVVRNTPNITFQDVPAGETTVRAAVFTVTTCQSAQLEITNITSNPPMSFGTPLGTSVTVTPPASQATQEGRLWISYRGTNVGDTASGSVTIRCVETNEQWTIQISANTIQRPTVASMLVLDKSGSMDWDSGIPGNRRIDVLRSSAPVFVDLLRDDDAIGIVSFDHDSYPVMPITPAGVPTFGLGRTTARGNIASHSTNPAGNTSIGDGVERAHNTLNPVTGFDQKAMVVFTDGHENSPKYLSDIASLINERVYAIGLGTADQLNPVALTALTNNTGGYLLMTGTLGPGDIFRLSKYFLQILADVTNADIVVDPESAVLPNVVRRIPFYVSEADISADVILVSPAPWAFQFVLETPNGDIIDPGSSAGIPGVTYSAGSGIRFYRMTLPVPVGPLGAHEGLWHAVLQVSDGNFQEYLSTLRDDIIGFQRAVTHGVPYSVSVHAYTNLRMQANVLQTSQQPGAVLTLRAVLTENGLPVEQRANVTADMEFPDRTSASLNLAEVEPGVFEGTNAAPIPGIYHVRFRGTGRTFRGLPFTREQVRTAAVWKGGDAAPPSSQTDPTQRDEQLCRLLECLFNEETLGRFLAEHNIEPEALSKCIRRYCDERLASPSETGLPQ